MNNAVIFIFTDLTDRLHQMVDDESTRAPIPSQAPKSAGSFPVDDTPNDLTTWDLIVYKSMLYSSMGKLQGNIVLRCCF